MLLKAGDGNTGAPLCCGLRLTFSITANGGRTRLLAPGMPLLETVQATEKGSKAARLRGLRRTGEEIHVTLFRTSSVCVNNHTYLCFLSQMGLKEARGSAACALHLTRAAGHPSCQSFRLPSQLHRVLVWLPCGSLSRSLWVNSRSLCCCTLCSSECYRTCVLASLCGNTCDYVPRSSAASEGLPPNVLESHGPLEGGEAGRVLARTAKPC